MTRWLGRMFDQDLAKAGVDVYEYQPSMIHAKLMTVDGLWTVAGSTNFDHRSFELNDEVNIVIRDTTVSEQIDRDCADDLRQSRRLTMHLLNSTALADRALEDASWVIRREE